MTKTILKNAIPYLFVGALLAAAAILLLMPSVGAGIVTA